MVLSANITIFFNSKNHSIDHFLSIDTKVLTELAAAQADTDRLRMLLQLRSSLFGKHWECAIFREFLDEKASLDEIYFYLSCRDALTGAPSLKNGDNFYEIVHYIKWPVAEQFLENILKRFNRSDIDQIKAQLFASTIKTKKVVKIDKAFVLRVLFEIYKSEKKLKYDYLKTMLETRSIKIYGIVTKDYLNHFEEFRWFFHTNFDSRTELDLIELYSECYNVSQGKIDFDTCYLVM